MKKGKNCIFCLSYTKLIYLINVKTNHAIFSPVLLIDFTKSSEYSVDEYTVDETHEWDVGLFLAGAVATSDTVCRTTGRTKEWSRRIISQSADRGAGSPV